MAIPKFQDFLYPCLLQLKDKDMSKKEMLEAMVVHFDLTDEDRNERTQSGTSNRLSDRIGWVRQWLRRALFIEVKSNGNYHILERGIDYLKNHTDLRQTDLMEYKEFYEYAKGVAKPSENSTNNKQIEDDSASQLTPTEQMDKAIAELNKDLAADVLQKVKEMSPVFFEQLVLDLLLGMGYGGANKDLAFVTPVSHDNGIDGVIPEDALGLDTIYIQAKRYTKASVGKPEIHQFMGALEEQGASKGVFITTGKFVNDVYKAIAKSSKKIILIDGQQLAEYMIKYNIGVIVKDTYEVKRINSSYFEE